MMINSFEFYSHVSLVAIMQTELEHVHGKEKQRPYKWKIIVTLSAFL